MIKVITYFTLVVAVFFSAAINAQPPRLNHAEVAETLNVTEEELREALGSRPFDFIAAAEKLGVTEEELRAAMPPPPPNGPAMGAADQQQ